MTLSSPARDDDARGDAVPVDRLPVEVGLATHDAEPLATQALGADEALAFREDFMSKVMDDYKQAYRRRWQARGKAEVEGA